MQRISDPGAYIKTLNPETEFEEIVRTLQLTVFPWDSERSLEFALFRTYAVPSISRLLAATGEFSKNPRKRYDDTELLLAEPLEHGLDSSRGKEAIARINAMHGRYKIKNDDFLYVLSTFVFEPVRWLKRFGWRELTDHEKQAWFNFYRAMGERMNIENLPDSMDAFEQFNLAYEAEHFVYAESNELIANKTKQLFLGFYLPKWLYWLGSPFVNVLMDARLQQAVGFDQPPKVCSALLLSLLKARKMVMKWLPKRQTPSLLTTRKRPSYPMGYAIRDLGSKSRYMEVHQ
ncbi:oxygenase MpaB family protein [Endozoicomonas arenosclerae]|uniref:oxygenase MpaB family protein n=1 Tax=Endozoicomonas arenosclerae TaxID=1633495 RepID=UPI000783A83F|nr:oxygenase MpaB family protein [Endozoicomonas arenosclerae]